MSPRGEIVRAWFHKNDGNMSDCARALGLKPEAVRVVCYRYGIVPSRKRRHTVRPVSVWAAEANKRGITVPQLERRLLKAVAESNLFDAVLDDGASL